MIASQRAWVDSTSSNTMASEAAELPAPRGCADFGRQFVTLRALWTSSADGGGEDFDEGLPQAHRAVADDQLLLVHTPAAAVAQQVGPRLGALPQTFGQSDQLLGAVKPHAEQDQDAAVRLAEPDLAVRVVGPHVQQRRASVSQRDPHPLLREPQHLGERVRIPRHSTASGTSTRFSTDTPAA